MTDYIFGHEKPPLDFLAHHGVKGMKWGVRRDTSGKANALTKAEKKVYRNEFGEAAMARFEKDWGGNTLDYSKLSSDKVTIKKGSELYRVVNKKGLNRADSYVSTNKLDRDRYRVALGDRISKRYEVTLKATQDLHSPSEKERVDAFITLLDSKSVTVGNKQITGREYLKRQGYRREVKEVDTQLLGAKMYGDMLSGQFMKSPLNDAYFKEISRRGYNMLMDDNDRGVLSDSPVIILNTSSTKRTGTKRLTKYDINEAKRNFKSVTKK